MKHALLDKGLNMKTLTPEQDLKALQQAAMQFADDNLVDLCREAVALDETGLFGDGKLHQLRTMCGFTGPSAQAFALGLINIRAIRFVVERAANRD